MTNNNLHTASSSSFPPSDWVETTLGEVVEIKNGGTPSTKNINFWDGDISWITPRDLSGYKKVFSKRLLQQKAKKVENLRIIIDVISGK